MINSFRETNCKSFYLSYIGMMCLYMILLRLNGCPTIVAYIVYAISIFFFIRPFFLKGLVIRQNLLDVKLISLFFLYYFISGLIYSVFGDSNDAFWIFKDYLYSLLPLLSYILVRISRFKIDKQHFLKTTLFIILIIDLISLIQFLAPSSPISQLLNQEMMQGEAISFVLNGLLGIIQMGFINVIGLSICLLSPIRIKDYLRFVLVFLFIFCALLTGQRTPIGGIVIVLFFYSIRFKTKGLLGICIFLAIFYYILKNVSIEVGNISVNEMLSERTLDRLASVTLGSTGREEQQVVLTDSAFSILFGDGVGRYSPVNPYSKIVMPDAMLYRIFNEMGLLGLTLFIFFFIDVFLFALKRKNFFMIALIIYVFLANFFNRILFLAPISIVPYVLIALFIKKNGND